MSIAKTRFSSLALAAGVCAFGVLFVFLVFFVFIVFLADALRLVAVLLVSARGETFAVFFLGILNILAD
ncbi:MAG: hypothetical protein IT343_00905 [Candidatus Melainabacteria bacterium]|nr:hypothetical protein [Candidatus Melainabacteria bacterium]